IRKSSSGGFATQPNSEPISGEGPMHPSHGAGSPLLRGRFLKPARGTRARECPAKGCFSATARPQLRRSGPIPGERPGTGCATPAPVFDALSKGFREARNRLAGLTELNEQNIQAALKEVRLSLLEADVELGVVKRFLARVEKRALGATVQTRVKHGDQVIRVSASDQFIKICHEDRKSTRLNSSHVKISYAVF